MRNSATESLRDPDQIAACRAALASLLNHWDGLTRFAENPHMPLDNNGSERAQRGPALGCKNYCGAASEWDGELAT